MDTPISVVGISDSPRLTTGFANVAKPIYDGFVEAGFDLVVFGMLDVEQAVKGELPYGYWPATPFDLLGMQESIVCVERVKPDVVWVMIDPGNLLSLAINLVEASNRLKTKYGKGFKIVAYPPIEGTPVTANYVAGFEHIINNGGVVTFWCKSAVDAVKQWSTYNYDYVYFGADHADFVPYSPQERRLLKSKVGLEDYFVVGSFGVNKRTKGFPSLIYTAAKLREMGEDKGIKFYCHTNPYKPVMQGHLLKDMAQRYGVADMFLWKPDDNESRRGNMYKGDDRINGTLANLSTIRRPRTASKRGELWSDYDFVTKMNCMDMYLDLSQVEGWGMPQIEAMKCGVPLVSVRDKSVREELYGNVAYMLDPTPVDEWDTWHTGARLVNVNPTVAAKAIIELRSNKKLRKMIADRGIEWAKHLKWELTKKYMNNKIESVARSLMLNSL